MLKPRLQLIAIISLIVGVASTGLEVPSNVKLLNTAEISLTETNGNVGRRRLGAEWLSWFAALAHGPLHIHPHHPPHGDGGGGGSGGGSSGGGSSGGGSSSGGSSSGGSSSGSGGSSSGSGGSSSSSSSSSSGGGSSSNGASDETHTIMNAPRTLTGFLLGAAVVVAAIGAAVVGKKKNREPKAHPLNGGIAKRIGLFSNFAARAGNRPNSSIEMPVTV